MNETNKIQFDETSNETIHKRPITDLVSDQQNTLISSDDSGKICISSYKDSRLQPNSSFEGYNGFSCNCLALFKNYLCAGYGSGHLRVFDIQNKQIISEVSAHAKWVTAIDVAPETGLILSTSEDSFVRIWKLCEQNNSLKY
ncbi:unnamed protein product [Oppiella nova]|uniref:WD repeat-containing protein 54 beta-propeller domain-containing protein n=1 Tax=Oppiella nova TaxID=334625 RepID=A0A7R9LRY8_9ACAR|nr:unnamed protein product [Oppiella nova]CAG2166385.1 unnamed protein product [Oppiella nova]